MRRTILLKDNDIGLNERAKLRRQRTVSGQPSVVAAGGLGLDVRSRHARQAHGRTWAALDPVAAALLLVSA